MILYTGKYANCNILPHASISKLDSSPTHLEFLVPSKEWCERERSVSEEEIATFTCAYYEKYLSHLEPSRLISHVPDGTIITSREDAHDFSHRLILAIWLELYYGFKVREVLVDEHGHLKRCRQNEYYQQVKELLSSLIKNDRDMHGFTSIEASYAYEQAQKVAKIGPIKEEFGDLETMYLRLADVLENRLSPKEHIIKPVRHD